MQSVQGSEKQRIRLLKTEMLRQDPLVKCSYIAIITPITISYIW